MRHLTSWRVARFWAPTRGRRAPGSLVLLALVAVGVGSVAAAASGARRTVSADERLLAVSSPPDAFVFTRDVETFERVAAHPDVADSFAVVQLGLQPAGTRCDGSDESYFQVFAPAAGRTFGTPRPRLVAGRFANPRAPDEAVVPELHARRLGVGVGDEIVYHAYDLEDGEISGCAGPVATVRVVGVIRELSEIGSDEPTLAATYVTPAFVDANPDVPVITFAGVGGWMRLHPGVSLTRFSEEVTATLPVEDGEPTGGVIKLSSARPVAGALDALAIGLWVLATVLAMALVVTLAVAVARQTAAAGDDLRIMSALGGTRGQLFVAAAVRPLWALALGVPLAMGVAVLLSRFHLVGIARIVEPDPGIAVDGTVLFVVAAGSVLLLGGIGAAVALRAAVVAARPPRVITAEEPAPGSRLARVLPAWAAVGVQYAYDRRRTSPLPTRSAAVALIVATAGVLAVLVFGVGVGRASEDPAVYGWGTWDAWATVMDDRPEDSVAVEDVLARHRDIGAIARVNLRFPLEIDGARIAGITVESVRGSSGPTVVHGRLPAGPTEIALGKATAEDLGVGVGDSVSARGRQGDADLDVVGIAAFPGFDSDPIARGWVADRAAVRALGFEDGCGDDPECTEQLAVSWLAGSEPAVTVRDLAAAGVEIEAARPAAEVVLVSQADQVPGIAAAAVGIVAAVGVLHALVVTVARRRRELATLRAIGFERRHSAGVVLAEAFALCSVCALVGGVLGLATGRIAWRAAAQLIGIGPGLPSTVALTAAVAVGVVVSGLLLAAIPAWRAAAAAPAAALRSE